MDIELIISNAKNKDMENNSKKLEFLAMQYVLKKISRNDMYSLAKAATKEQFVEQKVTKMA